jgi:CarboxypepD_reg-like domain/TonB-dependent Receptor Plug Domain
MKSFIISILLLVFVKTGAQNNDLSLTISFENTEIIDALNQIENKINVKFYYVDEWIKGEKVTGNYTNASINIILDDIFKETVINFYILDESKIILTRNNRIYDALPQGFFGNNPEEITEVISGENKEKIQDINPVFYNEERQSTPQKTELVRIGKENKDNLKRRFKLSGYAKNVKTGEFISNLAIVVKDKNIGTVTNKNGYYELNLPPGLNIIETSSLGTLSTLKEVIIYNDGRLDLNLQEGYQVLDEIIVEADIDKNVEETITGVTRIEVKEIKNIPLVLGERDILQVATTLPGITKTGEGSSGYNVRGGKEDQNLILLDNAVIYNPTHLFGIFSAINPYTSGEVNIYKGNIPAEYGGRLSSVFDIRTKDANTSKFAGEVSLGPVTSNVTLELPVIKDKAALIVGGRGTYSNWILRSLDDKSLKKSEANFYDAIIKYHHKINQNNTINATAYYSKDRFSITSDSLYSYSNRLFSFQWSHKFNESNKGSLILTNSEYQFDIEFDGDFNGNFDLGYKVSETELKLKMDYKFNNDLKFGYGLSGKMYSVNPGSINPEGNNSIIEPLTIPKERGLESAAFLTVKYKLSDKFAIDAGVRYSLFAFLGEASQNIYTNGLPKSETTLETTLQFDKNEIIKTYGGPEARLSARYFIRPDLSIKASYNNTYQYIHSLSTNTTVSPTDTWKLSDINIKPQQANQYSLGFYKNFEDNMYELSIEGYYKTSKNILDYKVGAQLLLNETLEAEVLQGKGKAQGIEFLLKKTKGKLNGWLGYTYSKSLIKLDSEFSEERVNNGEYFPTNFDKPHDLNLVANYKLTRRYSLSLNFAYQTGRPVTFPVGKYVFNNAEFVLFSDRNKFRIPDYYRLDIGFNVEGNHKIKKFAHSFWNFSIYNVLGRNNPYSVFFVTENGQIKAFKSSIFSIPIPTFTYNFKF